MRFRSSQGMVWGMVSEGGHGMAFENRQKTYEIFLGSLAPSALETFVCVPEDAHMESSGSLHSSSILPKGDPHAAGGSESIEGSVCSCETSQIHYPSPSEFHHSKLVNRNQMRVCMRASLEEYIPSMGRKRWVYVDPGEISKTMQNGRLSEFGKSPCSTTVKVGVNVWWWWTLGQG